VTHDGAEFADDPAPIPPKTLETFDDVVTANIVPVVVPVFTEIVPFRVSVFLTNILYPLQVNVTPPLTVRLL
jgi:hypothetical protein